MRSLSQSARAAVCIPSPPSSPQSRTLLTSLVHPYQRPQVLSGETRFSPDKAYPEKFGAEAPEQPQNTARVKKVGFSPSALALAAGAKQAGRNRTAAEQLADDCITAQVLRHCYISENFFI